MMRSAHNPPSRPTRVSAFGFLTLLWVVSFLASCSSNSNDPYWQAYKLFADTKNAYPEDRDYLHPDFEEVIQKFRTLPDKGTDRWVKAQRIAQDIEDARTAGAGKAGIGVQVDVVRDNEEATEDGIRALLDLPGRKETTPKAKAPIVPGKVPATDPKPAEKSPAKDVEEPEVAKAPEPPKEEVCEESCFDVERQCKLTCGCEKVGEKSLMCNLPPEKQACVAGCDKTLEACLGACST
jgi:hypothetical protein